MPTRSVAPNDGIIAVLTFDGVGDVGAFQGDTRNVTGFLVTNNAVLNGVPIPIHVQVEEELDKARMFEAVILPGQTLQDNNIPPGQRPRQYWNIEGPRARWDGLNIRWKEPA